VNSAIAALLDAYTAGITSCAHFDVSCTRIISCVSGCPSISPTNLRKGTNEAEADEGDEEVVEVEVAVVIVAGAEEDEDEVSLWRR
jgi:hypothetical protein